MIKRILVILLCVSISFNICAKKKTKKKKVIEVTNIFTCFDLDMATITNGDVIYCIEDTTGEKFDYNREVAIDEINSCLQANKLAVLDLLGGVVCINKE